jgi:hypothetical protein
MPARVPHRRGRRSTLVPLAAVAAGVALPSAAAGEAVLPPPGPWPTPVPDVPSPLLGTPYTLNGGNASDNARLHVWLPSGRRQRTAITRVVGGRTVVRGELTNADNAGPISGAVVTLVAQDVYSGGWAKVADVRTTRRGRFRAVLPSGYTRRAAVLYWPTAHTLLPLPSRRLLVRASSRVWLTTSTRGRTVRFRGRASGFATPSGGLRVAIQVRNRDGWITLRLPRSSPSGRFRAAYRFRMRRRYAVRALVPAQTDWPLFRGTSRVRMVRPR